MTTAQEIAALFDNDGQVWTAKDGRAFSEVADSYRHLLVEGENVDKWIYRDGSGLCAGSDWWDLSMDVGDDKCFCPAGLDDHAECCPLSEFYPEEMR